MAKAKARDLKVSARQFNDLVLVTAVIIVAAIIILKFLAPNLIGR